MRILQAAVRVSALLALAFVLANGTALAQEATAKIVGTITDPQGGVIPGAKVTVTNVATQVSREITTDRDGYYQVLALPIGTYRVSVEHPGFRKGTVDNQTLQINQVLRIDIPLGLGSPTEVVEVTAQVTTVETVNHTLGQSVTSRPVVNLPLNGRNVLDLARLQPGVTEADNPGNSLSTGVQGFSIAGGRTDSVTYVLDGGVNNNLLSNGIVFNPNPDTVAEFRILTSNYSAEYGRNGGGIISVVTKSGTNEIHGSAFEFLRNDALNANSFFNNQRGLSRDVLKRNQFGFTLGGPILLPKVNGRDKFFWFVGYQGQRLREQVQTVLPLSTFTLAELNGDFSLSNATRTGPNSRVAAFLASHPFFQPDPTLAAKAIIDAPKINAVARKYIAAGLIPTSSTGTLVPRGGGTNDNNELTMKFDLSATPKDRFAVTLGGIRNPQLIPFAVRGLTSSAVSAPGFPHTTTAHAYFANIAYTRFFSPGLVNEFRFTAQRHNQQQSVPARKLPTPAELGIGITPDRATGPTRLNFAGGMRVGFSQQGPTTLVNNTFIYSDTVSRTAGKHTWKFGASFVAYQNNTVFDFFVDGEFRFRTSNGAGNDLANFLLGIPRSYLQFPDAPSDIRSKAAYAFAQDEWHLLSNLVVTLGLRYEYSTPKLDTRGRSFSIVSGQKSKVFINAPVGLLFPGDAAAPEGANFPDKDDFAPRVGFAWDPFKKGKTSMRGGFGIFYDVLKGEDNLQFNGQPPFFGFAFLLFPRTTPNRNPGWFAEPFTSTGSPNPFPSKPPTPNIDFDANGFLPFGGDGVFFVDPNLRTPYTYQYNLSIQHEPLKNLTLETSYVGSISRKLTTLVDRNPFALGTPPNCLPAPPRGCHRILNAMPGNDDNSFSFLPEFRNASYAKYNSLEVSLTKRPSATRFFGTTYFTFAYTFAHNIDNSSGFRNRNSQVPAFQPNLFKASSDFDIRNRITFSGGWDLPFDRAWQSGPRRLTKGWSLYPIITWRTGFPLEVFAGLFDDPSDPGPSGAGDASLVHANLVGPIRIFDPHRQQSLGGAAGNFYFDPKSFSIDPATLVGYGTLPRNFFRGPSRTNVDLAIAKTTRLIGERLNMEFRAEFFNIFNFAEFREPTTNPNSSAFGQVSNTFDPRIVQFALRFTF